MRGWLAMIVIFGLMALALRHDISNYAHKTQAQPFAIYKENAQQETKRSSSATGNHSSATLTPWHPIKEQSTTHPSPNNSYDPRHDALYRWYLFATIVGVLFALVGLGFVITQTFLLTRSTKAGEHAADAAKESAQAAKISADAVINAERAWIFADIEPGLGSGGIIINTGSGKSTTALYVRVVCRNVGKNPAWITEISAKFIFTNMKVPLPFTPVFDIDDVQHIEPIAIAPNDPPFKTKDFYIEGDGVHGIDLVGDDMPVLYGIVKYRDVFSDDRYTTFGYMLLPGTTLRLQRLYGYPEYNHTA